MKKRIVYLTGFLLLVLLAQTALADVATDVSQAEGLYKAGQYATAEQAYLNVLREADPNKPAESDAVFTAGKKLALVCIATDRLPQAKDAVQQLLNRYAGQGSLPQALHDIVTEAKPIYKLAQVRQVYQDMVAAKPGDSQVIWLKMGVAIASVHLTDDQSTDAALQSIIAQHGTDDRASEALNHIAWACRNLKQFNKALTVYQYVVDNWPQKDRVAFTQHGIVICQLGLGNRPAADEALNVMLQKYGKDKDISKLLLWAGNAYTDAGEFEGGYRVFELVVQNYPDTPEALEAQIALAITVAQKEDRTRIEPAVQTLLTRFPANEVKARGLHDLATTLAWKYVGYADHPPQDPNLLVSYDKCLLAVANYTQATLPKSDWAVWAERDLATLAIRHGDSAAAEAAISRLTTDYADRKHTPVALHFLGDYYLDARKDDKAGPVYQRLVEKYPNHDLMPLVKTGLGVVQVRRGDDASAEAIFQQVLTDYANHPRLPEAINLMAEGYCSRALELERTSRSPAMAGTPPVLREVPQPVKECFAKAIAKWSIILQQYANAPGVAPNALYFSGLSYSREGDPAKAVECYQTLLEKWPEDERNQRALLSLPRFYKEMVFRGLLTEQQANPLIKAAYDQFIRKYPSSADAEMARQQSRYYGAMMEANTHEQ